MNIEKNTQVFHATLGKGFVLSITPKRLDNLIMCYFPKSKEHDWILESVLRAGIGDITLNQRNKAKANQQPTLEDLLSSIFKPQA